MSKIVTIEDVTKIVGVSNYIEALRLDKSKLIYQNYEIDRNKVKVHFNYEALPVTITINKDYRMIDMDCGCKPGLDYCPHIALAVMYLIEHEEQVNEWIAELNSEYDAIFNEKLFALSSENKKEKKQITLDINLKQIDYRNPDEYELQIKIGENKKYSLKKQLDEFLHVYREKEGEVLFGQNFCYSYSDYTFDEIDEKILEFVAFYVDSQNNLYQTFYGYHHIENKLSLIRLTKESLLQFMKLLTHKNFTVEIGYYVYQLSGIKEEFPFDMTLKSVGENIRLEIATKELKPLISSFEYVMFKDIMYHVKDYNLLKLILENKKQDIIVKPEEFSSFTKNILPKIEHKTVLDSILQTKFIRENPKVKYYFEKSKNNIIGKIHLCYQEKEIDLFDNTNEWDGIYLKRDEPLEQQYCNKLFKMGFTLDHNIFYLKQTDAIVDFLETYLRELAHQYNVYVSQELKEMKVLRHVRVESSFSLGRDNILSYQFEIEKVKKEELKDLIQSIQLKKKFYRLKNGDYVDLKTDELQNLEQIINDLELEEPEGEIPLYKSLSLSGYNKFIQMNDALTEFMSRFKSYHNLEIDWDSQNETILRDYQKVGIQWMLTLAKCGFSGILADEMGLGKSLQTIEYMRIKNKEEKSKMLLIVPTSLIYNWEHELKKFAPDLRYILVNASKSKRVEMLKQIDSYDVIVTTYGLLRQDIELYQNHTFDTCVIDEAQNIKNVNTETTKIVKKIHAKTRFALTGTPIENSVLELWSIFDFLMPGFLSSYTKFKSKYSIKAIEENKELLLELNNRIAPFILRRKKKDVLKELPDKIETNVYIDMTEEQKKLYLAELEQTKQQIEETIKKEGFLKSQILILSLLTRLRQICIDPRLYMDTDIPSGKLESLIEILKESIQNDHKILLFSQFPSALKLVEKELQENCITSYYLDGSTPSKKRMELVDAFNQDETNVFLISLKAGGTGLNLTSADIVIHLDLWWNPQVENQATDRSHRIGQKHVVEVIKLIAKGTIEEKIVELQQKKKNLSEQVVEGESRDQIILSKLTEEELRDLLSR